MKLVKVILVCSALAISACQTGWVRLDGSDAGDAELQRARSVCEVDRKLAALQDSRASTSTTAAGVSSNQARMLRIENYEVESARVYREIDTCMRREGLRKP